MYTQQTAEKNISYVLNMAERELGVPKLIEAADILSSQEIEQKSLVCYLSTFRDIVCGRKGSHYSF